MPRIARIVVPHCPHHVTQRGNRRQQTFFGDSDYQYYLRLLAGFCAKVGTQVWAYCLMPNHVHLVMVPDKEEGLRDAIGEAHRRYTRYINARENWARPFVAGAVSLVSDARASLVRRGTVYRA